MSKTKNSEGSSVLSIDNLSKEYTQQLQGLLISGHQDAMSMALFSVETFLNEQANKNLFITDLLIDFENNCTVKILSYTTKAPDKWKTKSLASFLHRAWEGIGSMGILIYRVRVSLGNAVQFDVKSFFLLFVVFLMFFGYCFYIIFVINTYMQDILA
jgi:hypothetical protein